ncbi:MAG: phage terminase large subunit [Thermodesulfobacteriota bacterium]|nr:phage terminase large subunit [Thermodesulfobacteriota bacterium]
MARNVDIPTDWLPLFKWRTMFYGKQVEFINAVGTHWEIVFVAGNGAGKTRLLYWNLICLALGVHPFQLAPPPLNTKILINDFEHGLEKIFTETALKPFYNPKTDEEIGPMLPASEIKSLWSRDDRAVTFNNGSILFFQTSEQKKKLHSGTNFDILACDEEADHAVYDESKRGLRTAKGGGKILHSFTPPFEDGRGPSWTKFKLVEPFESGEDKDIYVVRAAMMDNPAITQEYVKRFSKGKTERQLKIQLYGDYPTWGELVHPGFQDEIWDPETKRGHLLPYDFEVPFDDDVLFEFAIDWHQSKPPAILWTFEYKSGPNKGDVIVWDEMAPEVGKGKTILQLSSMIREIEGWRRLKIRRYGEPKMKDKNNAFITGFNAWEEFRHCGIMLTEGYNKQPGVGISIVNDFFNGKSRDAPDHPRVFIRENCKSLRTCLRNHYWARKGEAIKGEPDPKWSDYPVCLKYILQSKSRKIKKGMERKRPKWGLTSYGGAKRYGPYVGDYARK